MRRGKIAIDELSNNVRKSCGHQLLFLNVIRDFTFTINAGERTCELCQVKNSIDLEFRHTVQPILTIRHPIINHKLYVLTPVELGCQAKGLRD